MSRLRGLIKTGRLVERGLAPGSLICDDLTFKIVAWYLC